jgi:hypothetical protein
MKRTATWGIVVGVVALVAALAWAVPYIQSRRGTGVSPASDSPVGTAGRERADEPAESPATLHDLETVTGTVDPHELIGRRVDFHVQVADINNYTSFWVGSKDNRMLVVLGRDNRSEAQRIHGDPSPNDIKAAAPGQMVRITGTIEGIPDAEARNSWGVNDPQHHTFEDLLKDQKVYIRADHVTPEG